MSTIPVTYGSNPERLYYATDEFGEFAAILADSFEEAFEEALCVMHARDGECDHGVAESALLDERQRAQDSCDCSMSDDGPVWAIYLRLNETSITWEQFEAAFGEDVERIERKKVEALAA